MTKECNRGKDCIHPDGPELPLDEFYKTGLNENTGERYIAGSCKHCWRARQRARWHAESTSDMQERIDYIKSIKPSRRATVLFTMIQDRKITRKDLAVILRSVEWYVPKI